MKFTKHSTQLFKLIIIVICLSGLLNPGWTQDSQKSVIGNPSGPKILLFSRTLGFRHTSINAAQNAIVALGVQEGFEVESTEDQTQFNPTTLSQYAAVVFLMTTGDVLEEAQQAAFESYIGQGGGYVGIHSASDTEYDWPWYGGLVGAYFDSHPAQQNATIIIEDDTHPSTTLLPNPWNRFDEWYNFQNNPRANVNVLARLDESSYNGGNMGDDHPISWYHAYQGGRSWYTGMGHTAASYSDPDFILHLLGGIQYAANLQPQGPVTVDETGQWFEKQDSQTPYFMAGVGGPEGFLYETDQRKQQIVDQLISSGVNALYIHSIRSFEGDGYDFEDPFNTHNDASSGIAPGVFDNWMGFLSQLDENEIVTWFHIIDDTARPWGCDVPLNQDAKDYISALVNRFKDLEHLVWLSGEEFLMGNCSSAQDRALMSAIAAEIRSHDPIHPIGVHHNNGQSMQFGDDPNINVFAQQICGNSNVRNPQGIHDSAQRGDWVYVMAECHPWHLDLLHDNNREMIRQSNWATAMSGGYVLLYNAYECAHAGRLCSRDSAGNPTNANDPHDPSTDILADLSRVREFMEDSQFNLLMPNDPLASSDTDWVLANEAEGLYILYSYQDPQALGVDGLLEADYQLTWFNPVNGERLEQQLNNSGNPFPVPPAMGTEVALFLQRVGDGNPPPNRAPITQPDFFTTNIDQILNVPAQNGVLSNDNDPDNDTITAIEVLSPDNGVLQLQADGAFSYSPNSGFQGQDTFTYRASDGLLQSAETIVELQVLDPKQAIILTLINSDDNTNSQVILDQAQINLANLNFESFSINASTVPAGTQSIRFSMTGSITHNQLENQAPFALFGDTNGNYNGQALQSGDYMIRTEAFAQTQANGTQLADVSIIFSMVDTNGQITIFMNGFE